MADLAQGDDFWTRRRAAVRAEAEAEAVTARTAEAEAAETARESAAAGKSDEAILAELGLPDPDGLGQGDDFAAFLDAAVPERIRRRALRRLWRSNPVLANLDGLVDHGEDYSDAAMVLPGMRSAYQVGRGMLRHVTALDQPGAEEPAAPSPEVEVATEPEPEAVAAAAAPEAGPAAEPRRHMRFSFPGTNQGEEHG